MLITDSYILPTEDGQAVKMSKAAYDTLIAKSRVTIYQTAVIAAAAQILEQVGPAESLPFKKIIELVYDDPDVKASSAQRKALPALVDAGLVRAEGRTRSARYSLQVAV